MTKRTQALLLACVLLSALLGHALPAAAQTGPCVTPTGIPCADQTNQTTEIAKEVQLVNNAATQLQKQEAILTNAQSQLQQLQASGQTLTSGQWNGVQGIIGKIQQLNMISSDTANVNSEIQQHFQSDYPTYQPTAPYPAQFKQWNDTTTTAEAQALSIANAADAKTPQINAQLTKIAATTPTGQTQAIQQLTQVIIILTQQINELMTLQAASMKSMAYYYQRKQAIDNAEVQQTLVQNPYAGLGQWATPPRR